MSYMDPAEGQQVMVVLITEQLLHILHVTVVWPGWLFGYNHVGEHELVVSLRVKTKDQRGVSFFILSIVRPF